MLTRDNYEIWFVDYLDGNLGNHEISQLEHFLSENPDLQDEFQGIKGLILEPEHLTFDRKNELVKQDLDDPILFSEACVSFIENNASTIQKSQLLTYVENRPEKNKELSLFKATLLQANLQIVFPHKEKLYRKLSLFTLPTIIRMAAAMLAGLIVATGIYFTQNNAIQSKYVAHNGPFKNMQTEQSEQSEQSTITDNIRIEKNITTVNASKNIKHSSIASTIAPKTPKDNLLRFSKLEPLQAVQKKLSATVIVFEPTTLETTQTNAAKPKDPGLFASLFQTGKKSEEYINAARKLQEVRVTPSLLNLLAEVSSDRLSYAENAKGDIAEINYESRLLSFSVPVKSNKK